MTIESDYHSLLTNLHRKLTETFNEDELKTLCFDLGIDYENVSGDNKAAKARELVDDCKRKGRILELIEKITEQRLKNHPLTRQCKTFIILASLIIVIVFMAIFVILFIWFGTHNNLPTPPNAKLFSFENKSTDNWWAWDYDTEWIEYKRNDPVRVGKMKHIPNGNGEYLIYRLDLSGENKRDLDRNALFFPLNVESPPLVGISAQIYYEGNPGFNEPVYAGFVAQGEATGESHMRELIPDTWNILVWDFDAPFWWDETENPEINERWKAFKDLFDEDKQRYMQPGLKFDDVTVERIAIQFSTKSGGPRVDFEGTVYVDDILLIYKEPLP